MSTAAELDAIAREVEAENEVDLDVHPLEAARMFAQERFGAVQAYRQALIRLHIALRMKDDAMAQQHRNAADRARQTVEAIDAEVEAQPADVQSYYLRVREHTKKMIAERAEASTNGKDEA